MREYRSIQVISLFKPLLLKLGIDYETLVIILRMKLTMDGRRVPTIFNDTRVKKEGNQFLKSLWIYALYGLLITPFLFLGNQLVFQMGISFGIIIFILSTTMIADFSSVLLDIRDKNILHTKPADSKTINAAKILHILIYMFFVSGSLLLLPILVSLFKKGILFTLLFLVDIGLTIALVIVITSLLYLVVLRFFDGERLKDIINYVQILLSVGTIIGYQVVARSFDIVNFDISYTFSWWHLLLPPLWYGSTFEMLINRNYSIGIVLGSILGILVPILAVLLYIRLMPAFERSLDKLMGVAKERKRKPHRIIAFLANLTCRSKEERVFFRFATLMMRQEREFKLKVYPVLAMGIVFPFIFILMELRERSLADIGTGSMFLFIYFLNFIIPTVVHMLRYSGSYKGGWIFKAAPIDHPQIVFSGTLKAFLTTMYAPVFLFLSVIFIGIFSISVIPDLLAVALGGVLFTAIVYMLMDRDSFPFTMSFQFAQDSGSFKMFLIGLLTLLFVAAHTFANRFEFGIYVYIALLLVASGITWHSVFRKRFVSQ
ncbi:putative membrane protein YqjE [Sporosarcina luteola]|nr:putative membrane protein YqjE [Sporosarcina luteola]